MVQLPTSYFITLHNQITFPSKIKMLNPKFKTKSVFDLIQLLSMAISQYNLLQDDILDIKVLYLYCISGQQN